MKIVSNFNDPHTWHRTESDGHEAVWVTDLSDGPWVVILDGDYIQPNLPLHQAYAEKADYAGLWGAVATEYTNAKRKAETRVTPGCGAIGHLAPCP